MPIAGERKSTKVGRGYINAAMNTYAGAFVDLAKNIMNESTYDLYGEPNKVMLNPVANDALMNFFVEQSADPRSMTPDEYEDHITMMQEQYLNDREAVLEYANVGQYNPVIGLSFPLHKNILMNCIFDKGAIPKMVTRSPKFTETMERRYLVDKDGNEVDLFLEQSKIKQIMDSSSPFSEVVLKLPVFEADDTVDVLDTLNGVEGIDDLSIETWITEVDIGTLAGGTQENPIAAAPKWVKVNLKFNPTYGDYDRALTAKVPVSDTEYDVITATMKKNKFNISSINNKVVQVKIKTRIDTSNGLIQAPSVKWDTTTNFYEVPDARPINTPVSPNEVKDISALYNVDQLSAIMSMFQTVLENYKDDTIKEKLDESFAALHTSQKVHKKFDLTPRTGYYADHVTYRHAVFMDLVDSFATEMLRILNDPNMTITIIGRPDIIRKISPTEYTYQSPANIGPVELEFSRTVMTSDKRTYNFISSRKLDSTDQLLVLLCPKGTDRFIYRIYDYQMYVSNEIRNSKLYTLPAIHAYERWMFSEFQPVQGRIEVINPMGLDYDPSKLD